MFEDFFSGTRGTITGTVGDHSYRISFGERSTKVWLLVIAALIVGVILGTRGRR